MQKNRLTLWQRLFPFVPLVIGLLFIQYDLHFGKPDAQAPVAYMFVFILASLGMLGFTVCGWNVMAKEPQGIRYYRILFFIMVILNIGPLILTILFEVWGLALLWLVFVWLGFSLMNKEKIAA